MEQITDHAARALSRLAEQYKGKENLAAILNAASEQAQDIEDALWGLIAGRTLAEAVGVTLDAIGATVGKVRPTGADDDLYRGLIVAQIIVNTSEGTPETIYALLRQLGATGGWFRETGDYSADLQYTGTLIVDDDGLLAALIAATPPISLTVIEYGDGAFGFEGDPDALGFDEGELSRGVT